MLYDSTKVLTEVLSFVNKRTKLRSLTFVINHFSQNNRSEYPNRKKFTSIEEIKQNFQRFEGEKGAGISYTTNQTNNVS